GGAGALPPDHHDHPGGDGRGVAAGDRLRRGLGDAPAAGHRDPGRPVRVAAPDPALDAGDLPVAARPPRAQGEAQAAARGDPPPARAGAAGAGAAEIGCAGPRTPGGSGAAVRPLSFGRGRLQAHTQTCEAEHKERMTGNRSMPLAVAYVLSARMRATEAA